MTVADQQLKRPAGVGKTIAAISEFAATGICSYIEIEADYIQYQADMSISQKGTTAWRVDGEIKKPVIVGDEDMVVGGGGVAFCAEFIDTSLLNQNMKIVQTGGDFVYAYAALDGSGKNYMWLSFCRTRRLSMSRCNSAGMT